MRITEGYREVALKRSHSDILRLVNIQLELFFYDIEHLEYVRFFTEHGDIDAVIPTSTCYVREGKSSKQVFNSYTAFPVPLLESSTFFNGAIRYSENELMESSAKIQLLLSLGW